MENAQLLDFGCQFSGAYRLKLRRASPQLMNDNARYSVKITKGCSSPRWRRRCNATL